MEHTSKKDIEESRTKNEELYESLLRLEAMLADVQSGKTYQVRHNTYLAFITRICF